MTSIKKFLALAMAIVMVVGLVACGGSSAPAATQAPAATEAPAASTENKGEPRTITIGVWWDIYYDSTQSAPEDDPSYSGSVADQMRFDHVKEVEEKFNVKFEYVNMTYEGVNQSINTSVLAGTPDCDVYLCEMQFGVPAAINGLATDLKTVLPADADVLSTQNILNYLDLGDGKACLMKQVLGTNVVEATWPLAFNVQLLQDNNLEDPRELYARGEWTWDKFLEYLQVLTQDTDGDGVKDQWGMDGFSKDVVSCLVMSNGASIAAGTTETLSSPETGEALKFFGDLYNVYDVMEPYVYDSPWDVCRFRYRDGNVGFWPGAAWIFGNSNDYDWDGSAGSSLEFDTAFVQWPVGPNGNQETNRAKTVAGSFWFIPTGVEDPEFVYNVFEAITNWYNDDTTIRDDPENMVWWYSVHAKDETLQQENYDVMFDIGSREQFDLWDGCGVEMDLDSLIRGDITAAQLQEQHKQEYQAALDAYFG